MTDERGTSVIHAPIVAFPLIGSFVEVVRPAIVPELERDHEGERRTVIYGLGLIVALIAFVVVVELFIAKDGHGKL